MDVRKVKEKIPEEMYDTLKVLSGTPEEEQQRQDYLQKICQRLIGDEIDFERYPVYFCIVDSPVPNAAFVKGKKPTVYEEPDDPFDLKTEEEKEKERQEAAREQYPTIFVTKGLLEMVQNEDQLAYILGHELGHLRQNFLHENMDNSKLEEITSDLNSLDMMARSGYDTGEARKMAAKIFTNANVYTDIIQILIRAQDEHPNNESRLNAIDVKIKSIEDSYQKQNIDINKFVATPISPEIKEDIAKNRYISRVERDLAQRGYNKADLRQKQDILIDYLMEISRNPDYIVKDSLLGGRLHPYHIDALEKIIFDYVVELRKQMPRRVIKQSDYEKIIKGVDEETFAQIVGRDCYCHDSGYMREKNLQSFPFKIVADEDYEKEAAIQAQKEAEFRAEIENGTCLNVTLWDRLLNPELSFAHQYAGVAINGISGIDLTKTEIGRQAIREIKEILNNDATFVRNMPALICYYYGNNEEEKIPEGLGIRYGAISVPNLFYYRFKKDGFPSLNLEPSENMIGKNIPQEIFRYSQLRDKMGICTTRQVLGDIYAVSYSSEHDDPYIFPQSDWCFFINKDGDIIDSFPMEKFAEKTEEIMMAKKQELYQDVANVIKENYALLQQLRENPDIKISVQQLHKLHAYTGCNGLTGTTEHLSDTQLYEEMLKEDGKVTYYSDSITTIKNIFDEFRREKGFPFGIDFDKELLQSYLSPEEQEFISSTYSPENDNVVFNALKASMEKSINDEGIIFSPDIYMNLNVSNVRNGNYNFIRYTPLYSFTYSNYQFVEYYKSLYEKISPEKLRKSIFLYGPAVDGELLGLQMYADKIKEAGVEYKDIDFRAYKPMFFDTVASKLGIETDFKDYKAPLEYLTNQEKDMLSMALTFYVLQSESDKLPLAEIFNRNNKLDIFLSPITKTKIGKFLYNRENYPKDAMEAVKLYQRIPSEFYDLKEMAPFIIKIISEEKNPKKQTKATVEFLHSIRSYMPKEGEENLKNDIKNMLYQNIDVFDKSLPLIDRISSYQQMTEKEGFADDYKIQNQLLKEFIPEIEAIKDPIERNAVYDIFIHKDHRISDPDIRREYQRLWVKSVFEACGSQLDDNSEELHAKIIPYIKKLHGSYEVEEYGKKKKENNVNMVDRMEISALLADKFVSQQELSMLIKPEPSSFDEMDDANRTETHFQIAGFDAIKMILQQRPEEANTLTDFLLSKGSFEDCNNYSQHIDEMKKKGKIHLSLQVSPTTLQVLHREFWGYPLEARAVLINELLSTSGSNTDKERWEEIFDKVAPKIFPNAESKFSEIGKEFLHSYIKSRKENERTLYLAAMMVAANENSETTDPEKSLAKGIRLFLENSGPAAIKLGQAMASYADVPKFIRDEMQQLKSNASRPTRWELYEWLEFYKDKDGDKNLEFGKDVWLGKILGSASYFVTLEKGKFEDGKIPQTSERVTKILRAGAKISSDKEFKIFENMLYDLGQKGVMKNGIDSFLRLVKQAQETVEVETNLDIGYSQLETAKNLYKEKQIEADGYKFQLRVVDWPEYGKNWADMDRAHGLDLDQIQDPKYKKAVSKAYFTVELMNMLSGSRFDHDRHSKQLKIDPKTNTIGLFDTGAMAIVDPSEKDKELLGKVIYRTLQKTLDYSSEGNDAFGKIGAILSAEIEKVHVEGETTGTYLTECQRGLLALTDFYKDLSAKDFIDCINSAINNKDMPIDKSIIKGFVQEGIKEIGVFEENQPLLSNKDKETLGRLIFNVYASASVEGTENIGTVIKKEVQKLKDDGVDMPILNIISEKLSENNGEKLAFNIPKEFMPTISEVVGQSNIDVSILKGIMKEAVSSVDLQGQKDNYSEKDRNELGKLLYDTFDLMVSKRLKGEKIDMAEAFLSLQKSGQYQTELGTKVSAVIKTAQQLGSKGNGVNIDVNAIVKASLLSGKMDEHIAKGVSERFKEKHPNLLLRTKMAKNLNAFLSQPTEDMGVIKKTVIRMLVRKPNAVKTAESELEKQITAPDTGKKIIGMIKGYADRFARLIKQKQTDTNIRITDPARTSR